MIGMGFGMFASSMVIARLIREHNAAMAAKAAAEAEARQTEAGPPDEDRTAPLGKAPAGHETPAPAESKASEPDEPPDKSAL